MECKFSSYFISVQININRMFIKLISIANIQIFPIVQCMLENFLLFSFEFFSLLCWGNLPCLFIELYDILAYISGKYYGI